MPCGFAAAHPDWKAACAVGKVLKVSKVLKVRPLGRRGAIIRPAGRSPLQPATRENRPASSRAKRTVSMNAASSSNRTTPFYNRDFVFGALAQNFALSASFAAKKVVRRCLCCLTTSPRLRVDERWPRLFCDRMSIDTVMALKNERTQLGALAEDCGGEKPLVLKHFLFYIP